MDDEGDLISRNILKTQEEFQWIDVEIKNL